MIYEKSLNEKLKLLVFFLINNSLWLKIILSRFDEWFVYYLVILKFK